MMKKSILLIASLFVLFACSGDDDSGTPDTGILGEWKLMKSKQFDYSGDGKIVETDFSKENIIYHFMEEGILRLEKKSNWHDAGDHTYLISISCINKTEMNDICYIKINDSDWSFDTTNSVMTIGISFLDGPDLFFEKQ
ncbi:hypothetical protein ACFSTE_00270 [Aquimarina hainanensis]|uniref:Lipocalin-like domain-containing protein n=1 Tax=Aquimarina hainanensis TaxID=1578017 RepID=A0ABW5N268_9FLAO